MELVNQGVADILAVVWDLRVYGFILRLLLSSTGLDADTKKCTGAKASSDIFERSDRFGTSLTTFWSLRNERF